MIFVTLNSTLADELWQVNGVKAVFHYRKCRIFVIVQWGYSACFIILGFRFTARSFSTSARTFPASMVRKSHFPS